MIRVEGGFYKFGLFRSVALAIAKYIGIVASALFLILQMRV